MEEKDHERQAAETNEKDLHDVNGAGQDSTDEDAQAGVKDIEATTTAWSKSHLIAAYVMIWIIFFVDSMQQAATSNLTPYVTSSFNHHSLTPATGVMSQLMGGLWKLSLAKILDIWGRPQGYFLSIVVLTVGLIMMASCRDVEMYAAAQVFYWVGFNGVSYSLGVFIADTSSLRNRAFMLAYSNSPYIITTWIGGPIANAYLKGPGFRWGFGSFAIITPAVTLPLFFLMVYNFRKAKKMGLVKPRNSGRTFYESLKFYLVEFDVIGLLLITAGLALFLLPFNIYALQEKKWRDAKIIAFIIVGGFLCSAFAVWERWFAPVKYLPYELLTDRTVVGSCILAAVLFVSFFIWDSQFLSFLQVVNGLSFVEASYLFNTYSIGACLFALVVGVVIRWTGRFKGIALYFGVPLTILGNGLMLAFRRQNTKIGYIVMCQIFIAFAGGALVICEQIAIMAAVSHQYIAVVLAIEAMFASVGGAIGSTIASAIWQGVFPEKLQAYLPPESQGNFSSIYGSLPSQLSYERGSPTRDAISHAYADAQRMMLIASTAFLAIAIVAVMIWRDINVKEIKQVRGLVV